jgi:hypothetical protein
MREEHLWASWYRLKGTGEKYSSTQGVGCVERCHPHKPWEFFMWPYPLEPGGDYMHLQVWQWKFWILSMQCTYMFRLTPTMNSHFFPPVKFSPIGLSNRSILCSLWGTNWIYIYIYIYIYIVTSPRTSGFDPRPVYVRFVFAEVELGQGFLRVYSSVFPYQYRSTIFIHMLLLLEGQMDEAWEPSKKQFSFGSRGAFDRNVL